MRRVTEILKNVGLVELPPLRPDDLEFYRNRGTQVHKATALYDAGTLDVDSLDPRIVPFVDAWVDFRTTIGGRVEAVELEVIHTALDYVGHLDRVFADTSLCPGYLLLDVKTGDAPSWAAVQTAAYKLAYRTQFRRKLCRGAVTLKDDGKWTWYPHKDDRGDEAAWRAALVLDSWLRRFNK
jgi:hypothetical protein